jgi:cyclopropane-fatty-acyl-phospholipid synthase
MTAVETSAAEVVGRTRRSPLARAARSVVLSGLERYVAGGELVLELTDGSTRSFGDRSGPTVVARVEDDRLWSRIATRGRIGLGESYVEREWETDDLPGLFELLLKTGNDATYRAGVTRLNRLQRLRPRLSSRNSLRRARSNIHRHYDLGNDLFELFLDESMSYSCALWERPDESLAEAQQNKLRRLCERLELGPDDHVLEIGCGWGSFAIHAAREHGCRVTGLTLSAAQAELARGRVARAGLAGLVEIRFEDYRLTTGRYSKIASVEMIEAIGHRQLPVFFAACDRLLARDGAVAIQAIAIPDERYERYRRTPDWIERYIFPGSLIPSMSALTTAMTKASRLHLHGLEDIGPHYAPTLREWRARFHARVEDVSRLGYDERFIRTWDYYLAYCEAAFRTRSLFDVQLVLTRSFNRSLGSPKIIAA